MGLILVPEIARATNARARQALWGCSGIGIRVEDSFIVGEHSKRVMQTKVSCCNDS